MADPTLTFDTPDGSKEALNPTDKDRDDDDEEKVLVERNGEFLLIPKKDLEALLEVETNDQRDSHSNEAEKNNNPADTQQEEKSASGRVTNTTSEDTSSLICTSSSERESKSSLSHPEVPLPSSSPTLDSHNKSPKNRTTRTIQSYVPPSASFKTLRLTSTPQPRQRPWTTGSRSKHGERKAASTVDPGCVPPVNAQEDKKSRNELAFQEWLAKKRHQTQHQQPQHQQQYRDRPSTAVAHTGTWPGLRAHNEAFDSWLKKKQLETKTKRDVDKHKKKDSHEVDRNADGEKAFQMYIH